MDTTNTKYRIRQCSNCPGNLEYVCVTCSSDLCVQCGRNHMMKNLNKDTCNVILYREKSNYIEKHEICVRHPNNVYTKYCELCKIPICTICTDHRNHRQTDVGTAYEEKRRNMEIIKKIKNEALPIRNALLIDIDLDFETFFSDVVHLNSNILRNAEKLTVCLDNVLHEFPLENLCLKQKNKINKYIANTSLYEHKYEQSSNAPVTFLLSVKKHQSKTFKSYDQITFNLTTCMSLKTKTVIEKLVTINFTNKGKRLKETQNINLSMSAVLAKIRRTPQSIMSFWKRSLMLYSYYFPMESMGESGLG